MASFDSLRQELTSMVAHSFGIKDVTTYEFDFFFVGILFKRKITIFAYLTKHIFGLELIMFCKLGSERECGN